MGGESGAETCFELTEDAVSFALLEMDDDLGSACFSGDAPDAHFVWIAPADGRYVVTGTGGVRPREETQEVMVGETAFHYYATPPILAVRDLSCEGEGSGALYCSENTQLEDGALQRSVIALREGDPMSVVVQVVPEDAEAGVSEGLVYVAIVEIEPRVCGDEVLESATEVHYEGSLRGTSPPFGPLSCFSSDAAHAETSYRFVAPEAGTYRARVSEKYGDTLAIARYSSDCLEELACSFSNGELTSELPMELDAGEETILVVAARSSSEDRTVILDVVKEP